MCYYGDGHVTGDNHFILDVPHLLHSVVIFNMYIKNSMSFKTTLVTGIRIT